MKSIKVFFLLTVCLVFIAACKKKNDTQTPPLVNNDTANFSPYYFKFSFEDTVHNFSRTINGLYPANDSFKIVEGAVRHDLADQPNIYLILSWTNTQNPVTENDISDLMGKTLSFNDSGSFHPSIAYQEANAMVTSEFDNSSSYYVHFDTVSYIQTDSTTYPNIPVKVYLVTGTCNALVTYDQAAGTIPEHFTNGSFRLLMSHRYK